MVTVAERQAVFDFLRESWQSKTQPVTGPAIDWAQIARIVVHYTAAANLPTPDDLGESQAQIPARLRASQADYLANRNPPYSLGYNAMVDGWGSAWEIRGIDIKCAANKGSSSGPNLNGTSWAILCYVDGADPMTPAQRDRVVELIVAAVKRSGRVWLDIVGHRDIDATACPGDGIYRTDLPAIREAVKDALFPAVPPPVETVPPSPPPVLEEDAMPRQIRVRDDAAVITVDGLTATWVPDQDVQAAAVAAGLMTDTVTIVDRRALKVLTLVGDPPTYVGIGPAWPGRTVPADFARHVQ